MLICATTIKEVLMIETEAIQSYVDEGRPYTSDSQRVTTLDSVKQSVADKLHAAAEVIKEKVADNQNLTLAGYANTAAGWLDEASDYVQQVNPQQIKTDLRNEVRAHPGRSLVIAGAAGVLLGVLLRRR